MLKNTYNFCKKPSNIFKKNIYYIKLVDNAILRKKTFKIKNRIKN